MQHCWNLWWDVLGKENPTCLAMQRASVWALARCAPAANCVFRHARRRAVPGIEPGTSRARSENHATRPNSQLIDSKLRIHSSLAAHPQPISKLGCLHAITASEHLVGGRCHFVQAAGMRAFALSRPLRHFLWPATALCSTRSMASLLKPHAQRPLVYWKCLIGITPQRPNCARLCCSMRSQPASPCHAGKHHLNNITSFLEYAPPVPKSLRPSAYVMAPGRPPARSHGRPCEGDSAFGSSSDTVSERLRRWTRNPLGSARRGSNPLGVDAPWRACTLLLLGVCRAGPEVLAATNGLGVFKLVEAWRAMSPVRIQGFGGPRPALRAQSYARQTGFFHGVPGESTTRGFEPLRAEPNGFLVHHLSHSVTLSCLVAAPPTSRQTPRSGHRIKLPGHLRRGRCADSHQELAGTSGSPSIACVRHMQFGPPLEKTLLIRAPAP
jgi:hypothetical protein